MYKDGLPIQVNDEKRDDSHKIYQTIKTIYLLCGVVGATIKNRRDIYMKS